MTWLRIARPRLLLRCLMLAMVTSTWFSGAVLAQERPLQPVVQGDLSPGVPDIYTLSANAGDVIFGAFELQGTQTSLPVTVGFYDESNSLVAGEVFWASPLPIGFVSPRNGTYRIRIAAKNVTGGSYTLRTERQTASEWMKGAAAVTPTARLGSPRIAQLAKDLSGGDARAVGRFWAEAEARGGPLIEPIVGNDQYVLVTFLWKETFETRNVLVNWPGAQPDREDDYMSHVPGTNIWYVTVRVFRGSRFTYAIAPNNRSEDKPEPNLPFGRNLLTLQRDPLNPRLREGGSRSVLETPDAPDESWSRRTSSVRGTITPQHVDSVLLKGRRDVSVYTPPGYARSNGPYPLLILFDGETYAAPPPSIADDVDGGGALNTLDNLIVGRRIRPTVVCFVSDNRRNYNLNALEKTRTYAAAMATELVPWLRSSYAISTDPKDVVIGGESAGGGAAAYTALNYPAVFGNVLLQSGGAGLTESNTAWPKATLRFYIDVGLYELLDEAALLRNRQFRTVLESKGYEVTFRETGAAHEFVHWAATLAEGLIGLLGVPTQ